MSDEKRVPVHDKLHDRVLQLRPLAAKAALLDEDRYEEATVKRPPPAAKKGDTS